MRPILRYGTKDLTMHHDPQSRGDEDQATRQGLAATVAWLGGFGSCLGWSGDELPGGLANAAGRV